MFSLQVDKRRAAHEHRRSAGLALLGRFVALAAVLALAYAFDAFVLHHAIQHRVMLNDWGITRAAQSAVASIRW